MNYFRPSVDRMTGYKPGEQPKPGTSIIKLNTNENPYPPSPQALEVLRNFDGELLRRYPDSLAKEFCQAVSEVFGVPRDWIIVGNGCDELLNILIRACAEGSDRPVVYPTPTYILYHTLAAMQPAQVIEIPYPDDFQLPMKEIIQAQGAVTFIASPNSPSAHIVPLEDLRSLAQQLSGILVVDEAYVDFGIGSALPLLEEFENVILLRTLSKGYGLAGLRLGFGLAHPRLLSGILKVKDSYNVDIVAMLVGAAAIRDQSYKNNCAEKVKESRAQLITDLRNLGFVVRDSHTNFVLAKPPAGDAEQLFLTLKERGIFVRYYKEPRIDDKLRITVGTPEQNQVLLKELATLLSTAC